MTTLKQKTEKLLELRTELDEIKKSYETVSEPLKAERDKLQLEIITEMKTAEQFSIRYNAVTATLAVRRTPKVIDEAATIAELKKLKLTKEYVAPRLTDVFYNALPKMMKDTGKLAGVEIAETEYLSLRTADEDKDKRHVVTE